MHSGKIKGSEVTSTWVQIPIPPFTALVAVVQSLSCVQLFVTPWTAALQASLFFNISRSLLKFMSIESVMPNNSLILCHLLLLLSIFPSIRTALVVTGKSISLSLHLPICKMDLIRIEGIQNIPLWRVCFQNSLHPPKSRASQKNSAVINALPRL